MRSMPTVHGPYSVRALVCGTLAMLAAQGCQPQNSPPQADAGSDQNVDGGAAVTLDGSASADADGDTLMFGWVQVSGTTVALEGASTSTPEFQAPNSTETLTFQLTVTDSSSVSDTDAVDVDVTEVVVNSDPVADAGADQTVNGGAPVMLDGSASSDPDGDTLIFDWDQTGGTPVLLSAGDSASPTFVAPNGTDVLTFRLTVLDNRGGMDSDDVMINVNAVNQVPIAEAGPDQEVVGGDVVTLDGSASLDLDDDELSFSWRQIDGPDVALDDDDMALATFTAPTVNDTLTFELTVDDGNGGVATDTVDVEVSISPTLFLTNYLGDTVARYDISDPDTIDGNVAPDALLIGIQTGLAEPTSVIVLPNGSLLVACDEGESIKVYESAFAADGALPPDRVVQGADTLLDTPLNMFFDPENDELYVAGGGSPGHVLVFDEPDSEDFDGNVAPARVITSTAIDFPVVATITEGRELYVGNRNGGIVAVFADAGSLDGSLMPSRSLTYSEFVNLTDLVVTDDDTLFTLDNSANVYAFQNASTLDGAVTPDYMLTVTAANLNNMIIDTDGVGYIADYPNFKLFSFDDIESLSGTQTPDRVLSGSQAPLNGTNDLFIVR